MFVISTKNKWDNLIIIFCIAYLSSIVGADNDNNLLLDADRPAAGQYAPINVNDLSIDMPQVGQSAPNNVGQAPVNMPDVREDDPLTPQRQKAILITSIFLEAAIDSLPFVLAYLSNESPELAIVSLSQNIFYALIYAFCMRRSEVSERPILSTRPGQLLYGMCLVHTITSSICAFSSGRYYETLNEGDRLVNIWLNSVVGAFVFSLKIFCKRQYFLKLWQGRAPQGAYST